MQVRFAVAALALALPFAVTSSAFAHVSLAGPGYAGQTQVLTFSVGHGCSGADTVSVEITVPSAVTSVRAMPNVFGDVEVKADDAGVVSAVKWSKAKPRAIDDHFYQLSMRVKLPDAPFTTLLFPAKQVCRSADGQETTVDWVATAEEVAGAKEGEGPEPAPSIVVLPVRTTGWNKFKVEAAIKDLKIFNDAQIVWSGDAAYSANPNTAALIKSEADVTELKEIKAGAEIWVKY